MSLYSMEEICTGCVFANWHNCEICGKITFCHCSEDYEQWANCYSGRCEKRTKE